MSEQASDPAADKLAERLTRMKPAERRSRSAGFHPYALSAVTAVAGAAVGAWLVLAAPDAPEVPPVMPTASVSGFQGESSGTDGFSITKALPSKPQITPTPPDTTEADRLRAEIDGLKGQIEVLRNAPAPSTDGATLTALRAQLEAAEAEAKSRAAKLSEIERENIRLQTELDTKALIADDTDASDTSATDLAREEEKAAALRQAQVTSDMVAVRAGTNGGGSGGGTDTVEASSQRYKGDEAFVRAGATATETRQASIIANPDHTIVQGTLIEASLETAINTQLAGVVTAVVSHDVRSFDMSRVLVPRGSRLFGRYDSDVSLGQRRVLIAWDRVVTTDGQSVSLAAFGTDRIGRSGLPGTVRTHFLQRFGTAALISVIGAIPTVAAAKYADDEVTSDTVENVGNDFGTAVSDVMAEYLSIPPTISIDQGAVVMVRVDADLEFY